MSSVTCKCVGEVPGRTKACQHHPGFRMKNISAFKLSAQCYRILFDAVDMYLPELKELGTAELPRDVGSPAREVSRRAAVKWACDELTIAMGHLCGDCSGCDHGPLGPRAPTRELPGGPVQGPAGCCRQGRARAAGLPRRRADPDGST